MLNFSSVLVLSCFARFSLFCYVARFVVQSISSRREQFGDFWFRPCAFVGYYENDSNDFMRIYIKLMRFSVKLLSVYSISG